MMNLFSAIELGKNSLLAQQQVFSVIGHNIANVNTEGYSRQIVDMESVRPSIIGLKYSGRGVDISNIRSVRDRFINNQIIERNWYDGKYDMLSGITATIESLFDEAHGLGLSDGLTNFFNSWNDVANSPSDIPTRNQLVSTAQSFTRQMNNDYQRLIDQQEVCDDNIGAQVTEINNIIDEIGELNEKISIAEGSQSPANDLLDQRERRIRELAKKVGINFYFEQSNNSATIELAGRPLVTYNVVNHLSVVRNPYNSNYNDVYIEQYGQPALNITREIDKGELGALILARDGRTENGVGTISNISAPNVNGEVTLTFSQAHGLRVGDLITVNGESRVVIEVPSTSTILIDAFTGAVTAPTSWQQQDGFIPEYKNYLDSLAASLIKQVNDAHQSGFALDTTTTDLNFFNMTAGTAGVTANINGTNAITFSASVAGVINVGDVLTIDGETRFVTNVNGANVTVDSAFTNTNNNLSWEYAGLRGAASMIDVDANITANPDLIAASGLVNAGPPPTGAVGNNQVALMIAQIMDNNSVVDTNVDGQADYGTFHEYLHSMYSDIGNEGNTANYELESNSSMLQYLENRRDSISSVSLDEEAANLMQFEKSYQALAQFMRQVSQLTDVLMQIV